MKYNDGVVRKMKDGKFERNAIGQPAGVERPGYPKEFLEEYVKQTGDRYKMPDWLGYSNLFFYICDRTENEVLTFNI